MPATQPLGFSPPVLATSCTARRVIGTLLVFLGATAALVAALVLAIVWNLRS